MHFGAFFYGTVDMPDAGVDGPPAHARNYGQESYRRAYDDLIGYAQACDTLGYDSMWTAEHHFHNHGFEVVPNVVLFNAVLAQHTRRIRLGALIHVLTTWHPIHFAEDYALADVLSGGRLLCGLGRGTEERESNVFGVNVGYNGNADDTHNRDVFEEQVEIFKAATTNERFAYRGKHYTIPPAGLTFRGEPVTEFPLVPRPIETPVRIYQPISSEETLVYAARQRHVGEGVILGEVDRVPGGQDVDQRPQADAPRALGQDRVQENDVRDDLEPVVVEVVLGGPHRVVPERVTGFRVGEEIGVGAAVALLTVAPRVRRRPVDAGVGHVHGPIEERAEMHLNLPAPARSPNATSACRASTPTLQAVLREYTILADQCNTRPAGRRTIY